METIEKYNGWKNRSTWLVILHLDNTSKEVNELSIEKAIQADTLKQFKALIRPVLSKMTPLLWKESDFDILKTDFTEVWNHLAGYKK